MLKLKPDQWTLVDDSSAVSTLLNFRLKDAPAPQHIDRPLDRYFSVTVIKADGSGVAEYGTWVTQPRTAEARAGFPWKTIEAKLTQEHGPIVASPRVLYRCFDRYSYYYNEVTLETVEFSRLPTSIPQISATAPDEGASSVCFFVP